MNRYISDLHFGHANILKFDNRPFRNTEEMETALIENWNSTVFAGDTTYILGDFCWGKEPEWKRIVPLLNGNKVLIRGNHDLKEMSSSLKRCSRMLRTIRRLPMVAGMLLCATTPCCSTSLLTIQTVICFAAMSIQHGKMISLISGERS